MLLTIAACHDQEPATAPAASDPMATARSVPSTSQSSTADIAPSRNAMSVGISISGGFNGSMTSVIDPGGTRTCGTDSRYPGTYMVVEAVTPVLSGSDAKLSARALFELRIILPNHPSAGVLDVDKLEGGVILQQRGGGPLWEATAGTITLDSGLLSGSFDVDMTPGEGPGGLVHARGTWRCPIR